MDARKTLGAVPPRGHGPAEYVSVSPEGPLSAEQVYQDYAPRVYNMARRMVASDIDAEATQLLNQAPDLGATRRDLIRDLRSADDDSGVLHEQAHDLA